MKIRTNKQGGGTGRKQRWLGEDSLEKLELFTSDWELNPRGRDLNLDNTHRTCCQDLVKLRFLVSHHRKNSVRDKVIVKKWIYSDSERSTLHRQSVGHCRGRVRP